MNNINNLNNLNKRNIKKQKVFPNSKNTNQQMKKKYK